jgi:hypothetical protein
LETQRGDVWYAAVQAESLDSANKAMTFTFSWSLKDSSPKTVATLADPLVGTLSNGEVKGFFIPFSSYSHPGSWLRYVFSEVFFLILFTDYISILIPRRRISKKVMMLCCMLIGSPWLVPLVTVPASWYAS